MLLFARIYVVVFKRHVFFHSSRNFQLSVFTLRKVEKGGKCLAVLFCDHVSVVLEDLVEVGEGQVSVQFCNLSLYSRVGIACSKHVFVLIWRVMKGVQVIVVNISATELVGNLVFLDVSGPAL